MRPIYPVKEDFVSQIFYKYQSTPPPHTQSSHISTLFQLGWLLCPIYSATGDYPPVMKEWMAKKSQEEGYSRSRLPSFTKEEIEMVKGEFQFRTASYTTSRKEFFLAKSTSEFKKWMA